MATTCMGTLQTYEGSPAEALAAWAEEQGFKSGPTMDDRPEELVPVPVMLELVRGIAEDVHLLKKLARWGLGARMIFGLLLTFGDMLCDILVALQYSKSPTQHKWAYWSFGSIVLSLFAQVFACWVCRQSTAEDWLTSMFGLKQMLETWRVISGAPTSPAQIFSNETMLAVSRVLEVVFESVPQAVLQGYVILQTGEPTLLQYASFFGSIFTTGWLLTNANYDIDRSFHYRKIEPHSYGMYPLSSRFRTILVFVGENLFVSGFNTVRVVALVVSLSSPSLSDTAVVTWMAVELGVFFLAKLVDGSFWWWIRTKDTVLKSAAGNLAFFVICTAAPCTWVRQPMIACPHVYTATVCVALVSSLAMVVTVFHLSQAPTPIGELQISKDEVWGMVAIGLGAVAFGLLLMFSAMVKTYRKSFTMRCTQQQHIENHLWAECTYTTSAFGTSRNDARARMLTKFATRYWPAAEKVKEWIHDHWAEWNDPATQPVWFDKKFIKMFPSSWLPSGETELPRGASATLQAIERKGGRARAPQDVMDTYHW